MTLKFPALPPGPVRELFLKLHELHSWAGEPSVREIGEAVGCSHHKIHQMFTQPRVPSDGSTFSDVVLWLAKRGSRPRVRNDEDEERFLDEFEEIWRAAKTYETLNIVDGLLPTIGPQQVRKAERPVQVRQNDGSGTPGLIPSSAAAARLPYAEQSRAIFVGVEHFESYELGALPAVFGSSRRLAELLTDDRGGFDPSRTTFLRNPRHFEVGEALEQASADCPDTLLFYFGGHGVISNGGELYLATGETKLDRLFSTAVPYDLVRRIVSATPARQRVVILDTCYSGRAIHNLMGELSGLSDVSGTAVFTSAGTHQAAFDGQFTGEFASILESGIPNGDQFLTLNSIYRQLSQVLRERSAPNPQATFQGNTGDLALRYNAAATVAAE